MGPSTHTCCKGSGAGLHGVILRTGKGLRCNPAQYPHFSEGKGGSQKGQCSAQGHRAKSASVPFSGDFITLDVKGFIYLCKVGVGYTWRMMRGPGRSHA